MVVVGRNLALDWMVVGVKVSRRREGETEAPPPPLARREGGRREDHDISSWWAETGPVRGLGKRCRKSPVSGGTFAGVR